MCTAPPSTSVSCACLFMFQDGWACFEWSNGGAGFGGRVKFVSTQDVVQAVLRYKCWAGIRIMCPSRGRSMVCALHGTVSHGFAFVVMLHLNIRSYSTINHHPYCTLLQ